MRDQRGLGVFSGMVAIALVLGACSGTATVPVANDPAASQLAGVTDQSIRIGVVRAGEAQSSPLSFGQTFTGLDEEQIASVIAAGDVVAGRNVGPVLVSAVGNDTGDSPEVVCEAQRDNAVVLMVTPQAPIVRCLAEAGVLVIDASAGEWDDATLQQFKPFVWAPSTADAAIAEQALWEQARDRKLIGSDVALVDGPSSVSTNVSANVSLPFLSSVGATTQQFTIDAASFDALSASTQAALASAAQTLRPSGLRAFPVLAANVVAIDSRNLLATSTDNPGVITQQPQSFNAEVAPATQGLGWDPIRDGTVPQARWISRTPEQTACLASAPSAPPEPAAEGALLRLCDAVQLLELGAPTAPAPFTASAFRDAVWALGSRWQPAAVTASGWSSGAYVGVNTARWFSWTPECPGATTATGCFAYDNPAIPLDPTP